VSATRTSTDTRGIHSPLSSLLTCCRLHPILDASSLCFHPRLRRRRAIRSPTCLTTGFSLSCTPTSFVVTRRIVRHRRTYVNMPPHFPTKLWLPAWGSGGDEDNCPSSSCPKTE